jgi:alpha-tubulin suppressor-like RCC1 family protein
VKGEDNHVQVACGLNFTVALTNNGEVYQMGNTGAQNNREKDKADWKVRSWCKGVAAGCSVKCLPSSWQTATICFLT